LTRKITQGGSSTAVRGNNEKIVRLAKFKFWKFTIIAHISYDGYVKVKVMSRSQIASLPALMSQKLFFMLFLIEKYCLNPF